MHDSDIVDLYFARSEAAIEETARKYGAYCNKIAYNILLDIFDAEECVNDTYLKAWGAIPPTRPKILGAFLSRITRNLALDRYSKRHAQKRGGHYAESLDELAEVVGKEEDALDLSELGAMISDFLRKESNLSRRIFVQRYFHERSIREIADFYSISEGRVKISLFRTRERLRTYLIGEGVLI